MTTPDTPRFTLPSIGAFWYWLGNLYTVVETVPVIPQRPDFAAALVREQGSGSLYVQYYDRRTARWSDPAFYATSN